MMRLSSGKEWTLSLMKVFQREMLRNGNELRKLLRQIDGSRIRVQQFELNLK